MILKPAARRDVDRIMDGYRAEADERLAERWITALQAAFEHVGRHPDSGSHRHADAVGLPDLRFWPIRKFPHLVFYVADPGAITVLRILHGQRDVPALLQGDPEPEDTGD